MTMKLNIGCGDGRREGFVGVDIRAGVDIVCAAWEVLDHVSPGSVEEIYSRHMIEHLTREEARRALLVWREALCGGGRLEILAPDLAYHCRQIIDEPDEPSAFRPSISGMEHALCSIYGWQQHEHDLHRWGYTHDTLTALLQECGFINIRAVSEDPWHIHLVAEIA